MKEPFDLIIPRLRYEPETGKLFWANHRHPGMNDREAGWVTPFGYARMNVYGLGGKCDVHLIHIQNLIWYMVYGELVPEGYTIDHIDGDGLNNRIANMRLATPQQQIWYRGGLRSDTSSGFRGVRRRRGKWNATYQTKGAPGINLGTYDCRYEAAIAYVTYCSQHHGAFWCCLKEFANLEECMKEIYRMKAEQSQQQQTRRTTCSRKRQD